MTIESSTVSHRCPLTADLFGGCENTHLQQSAEARRIREDQGASPHSTVLLPGVADPGDSVATSECRFGFLSLDDPFQSAPLLLESIRRLAGQKQQFWQYRVRNGSGQTYDRKAEAEAEARELRGQGRYVLVESVKP